VTTYLGESGGGRVFRQGVGTTDAGTGTLVRVDVETWELRPTGSRGASVIRQVDLVHYCANGATWDLTVYVDGVARPTQRITRSGSGTFTDSIYEARRGVAFSVRAVCVARGGDVAMDDIVMHVHPKRVSP